MYIPKITWAVRSLHALTAVQLVSERKDTCGPKCRNGNSLSNTLFCVAKIFHSRVNSLWACTWSHHHMQCFCLRWTFLRQYTQQQWAMHSSYRKPNMYIVGTDTVHQVHCVVWLRFPIPFNTFGSYYTSHLTIPVVLIRMFWSQHNNAMMNSNRSKS